MSSGKINDLDLLFPNVRKPADSFTAGNGKRYEFTYFIPAGVSLISSKKTEDDPNGLRIQLQVLECFFKKQYPHMNADWIEENISLQLQNYIYLKIVKELGVISKLLGEEREAATPE